MVSKKSKLVYHLDVVTGDWDLQGEKDKYGYSNWAVASLSALGDVLIENGDESLKVLGYILKNLEFGNKVYITQTKCAESLKMAQPHVNRALKKLIADGIIEKGELSNRQIGYTLNHKYLWKGSRSGLRRRLNGEE